MTANTSDESRATRISPVDRALERLIAEVAAGEHSGDVADYIPELAAVDPDRFAVSATSIMGRQYGAGDLKTRFTIQSISKPFVYALALAEHGTDAVLEHVGVEPSGQAFNAISFDAKGRPFNPMINAGAIVTTSLIGASDGDERFQRICAGLSAFAGRTLEPDDVVYRSESETGDRNRALALLARSSGALRADVDDAVEPYFRQCALAVDARDLAVMAATIANNGVNPLTGVEVVEARVARHTLSLMSSCGMYDRSGEWLMRVGLPAKSGVGGGIVAVSPGEYGVGVFSPPLDSVGNSSRGVALLQKLSDEFRLHSFGHPTVPIVPMDESFDGGVVTLGLRGEFDFVAVERLISRAVERLEATGATALLLDLRGVTWTAYAAERLLAAFVSEARAHDPRLDIRCLRPGD
ncbi:glutaminase A [Microbacterium halophytorum]|uniref:glutaminase A n=1 Tax=Microbacterium halophytorum TaxID=2067568 RepID=UPI000CFB390C|nr:glutaminase A [Microbacterium halophytorum]